jgi:hypothetical protein
MFFADTVIVSINVIYTEYYMSKSVSHAVSTREPYITPRAIIHVFRSFSQFQSLAKKISCKYNNKEIRN